MPVSETYESRTCQRYDAHNFNVDCVIEAIRLHPNDLDAVADFYNQYSGQQPLLPNRILISKIFQAKACGQLPGLIVNFAFGE